MIDYHTPRFKSTDVAQAIGMPINTFRTYFKRGKFRLLGTAASPADTHGLPHLFSLRDALGFAVAIKLMAVGAPPEIAWKVGMVHFAHTGDEERPPAALFNVNERGETLLLYWHDSQNARLVAADDVASIGSLGVRLDQRGTEAVAVIVVNLIVYRVMRALGVERAD